MKALRAMSAVLITTFVASIGACASDTGTTGLEFRGFTACENVSDCQAGQACSKKYGFCFKALPIDTTLVFSIQPALDPETVPDQFNNVASSEPGRLDVTLTPETVVSGRIVPHEDDHSKAYRNAGRLMADAGGRIPGLNFRHEVRTVASSGGTTWEIAVAPDIEYAMTFVPDDTRVPSVSWSLGAGVSGTVTLAVKDPLFHISGVVRRMSGETRIPIAGIVVQAMAGGRPATSDTTDTDGVFSLTIPETPGPLTIDALPGDSGMIFPARTLAWDDIDDFKAALPLTNFLVIDVDPIPDVATISFQVLSVATGGSRIPMGGAGLFIERVSDDGAFRTRTVIDGNGFSALALPAGLYSVAVLPPGGTPTSTLNSAQYAKGDGSISFDGLDDRIFGFELAQRPLVSGRVVSAVAAAPVPGARVLLATDTSRILDWQSGFSSDIVFEAVTDANGEFSVRIEPGSYAMQVVPPVDTGLATASWPQVTITGTEYVRLELGGVCLLTGTLVSTSGAPQGDALLTFFQPTTDDVWDLWPMKLDSWANAVREIGTTGTDANGRYEILLPCPDEPAAATGVVVENW